MKSKIIILVLAALIMCGPASAAFLNISTVLNQNESRTNINGYLFGNGSYVWGVASLPGGEGQMNQTINMTPNMTANFTAGPPGAKGDKGDPGDAGATGPMNQTFNLTPNMTPNMTAGGGRVGLGAVIESDFYDPSTQAIPGFLGAAISSGTVGAVATTANHPGVIYMRDSTTANGGYRYGCAGTQLIAGGETFETVFQSVGTRITQHARLGWADSTAGSTMPTDGVYFNITNRSGVAGGNFNISGVTASNSARTVTASQYPLTASTWYRGTIQINAGASLVTYTLYDAAGSQLWTDTVNSNIPTGGGRDTSPCIIAAETTTDAAANILVLDYVKWSNDRSLTR